MNVMVRPPARRRAPAAALRWRGFAGLGQSSTDPYGDFPVTDTVPVSTTTLDYPNMPTTSYPTAGSGGGVSSPAGAGFNWGSVITAAINQAGRIGSQLTNPLYNLAPGTFYQQTPGGVTVATAGAPVPAGAAIGASNLMPLLLLAGGVVLLMSFAKK